MKDEVFQAEFLNERNRMMEICPIDAFVLVLKFESDRCDGFKQAAEQFTNFFGTQSLKSLVILCIQSNNENHFSDQAFDKMFKEQRYYNYLKERNCNTDIPYCLWNNIHPYPNQNNNLLNCLENRKQITSENMGFIFDFIQNDLDRNRKLLPTHYQPKPQSQPKKDDDVHESSQVPAKFTTDFYVN
jgi:hypothetical protein